jgi:hypothetical protein
VKLESILWFSRLGERRIHNFQMISPVSAGWQDLLNKLAACVLDEVSKKRGDKDVHRICKAASRRGSTADSDATASGSQQRTPDIISSLSCSWGSRFIEATDTWEAPVYCRSEKSDTDAGRYRLEDESLPRRTTFRAFCSRQAWRGSRSFSFFYQRALTRRLQFLSLWTLCSNPCLTATQL